MIGPFLCWENLKLTFYKYTYEDGTRPTIQKRRSLHSGIPCKEKKTRRGILDPIYCNHLC